MDFFDVIFLFFSFMIVVIPAVEKIKNRKKEESSRPVTDLLNGSDKEDVAAADDEVPFFKIGNDIRVKAERSDDVMPEEGVAAFSRKILPSAVPDEKRPLGEVVEQKEKIDPKKLVIYSEILKPKF